MPVHRSSTFLHYNVKSALQLFERLLACRQGASARVGRSSTSVVVPHAQPQPAAPARTAAGRRPDQWRQGLRGAVCRQMESAFRPAHACSLSSAAGCLHRSYNRDCKQLQACCICGCRSQRSLSGRRAVIAQSVSRRLSPRCFVYTPASVLPPVA